MVRHFLAYIDDMACCYLCFDQFQFLPGTLASQGIGFLETLKNPANLFKNNLNNTRNNMKSQIQNNNNNNNNNNDGIAELLIPTFFQEKLLLRGQKLFHVKKYGEVVLNWRTNDQVTPRFGRSFINDKCIFQ